MRQYRLASPALRSLREILAYLSSHSTTADARFLRDLDQRLRLLAQHPMMGVQRPEFGHPGLRFLTLRNYLIAYDPTTKPVVILAIRHAAQDPESLFAKPGP